MAAIINISGVDMPSPSRYKVILRDLDSENTQRSETGVLHRDRIRVGVYEIDVSFQVEHSRIKMITDALRPAKVSVVFFDPTTNAYPMREMYSGDRTGELIIYKAGNPDESLWELSTTLTEY
ncbi:MAG: hypothetical protein M0P69_14155 [Bacteroidales bacterium]|nr:hypothetical protein [Bacteroidales bacterium]